MLASCLIFYFIITANYHFISLQNSALPRDNVFSLSLSFYLFLFFFVLSSLSHSPPLSLSAHICLSVITAEVFQNTFSSLKNQTDMSQYKSQSQLPSVSHTSHVRTVIIAAHRFESDMKINLPHQLWLTHGPHPVSVFTGLAVCLIVAVRSEWSIGWSVV